MMNTLPLGYYAVLPDGDAQSGSFIFKGAEYSCTLGVNAFSSLEEAVAAALETPECVLSNLGFEKFETPVILLGCGEFPVHRITIDKSITVLGQNCEINPNNTEAKMPSKNTERKENESVLCGSYWFGIFSVRGKPEKITFDGITLRSIRFHDDRTYSASTDFSFLNLIHEGNCRDNVYLLKDGETKRRVLMQNLYIVGTGDYGYSVDFLNISAEKATLCGICFADSAQRFCRFVSSGEVTFENSFFYNLNSVCGFKFLNAESFLCEKCVFADASAENESVFLFEKPNAVFALCTVSDSRENRSHAVQIKYDTGKFSLNGCKVQGFCGEKLSLAPPQTQAADFIDTTPRTTQTDDPHEVVLLDGDALSLMEKHYKNAKARYCDLHVHTKCGGTSDGSFPMENWTEQMDRLGLDFVAVVDHRQVRGFYLPEWAKDRFIMGTEPAANLLDGTSCLMTEFHYLMLVPQKDSLLKVFEAFPEFKFTGDELTGSYIYPNFTKERIGELARFIKNLGGIFVHAHPKVLMSSTNPEDYFFEEKTYMETIYETTDSDFSKLNYDLWTTLLKNGHRLFTSGCSDTHRAPSDEAISVIYTENRTAKEGFERMRSGDITAGFAGLKMFIGGCPMGSDVAFREGLTLTLIADDFKPDKLLSDTAYELRIYTDKGLAFASAFNGKMPQKVSLAVKKRRFYRAEIVDITHGIRVSIGNPIWLD